MPASDSTSDDQASWERAGEEGGEDPHWANAFPGRRDLRTGEAGGVSGMISEGRS